MTKVPNSRVNLDKAINRFAGNPRKADALRNLLANVIVAQMIPEGVVKGGSSLKFRYGSAETRATMDLDTAWKNDLDTFLVGLKEKLSAGWGGFAGTLVVGRQASPKGIPFDYVMQPCDVKLTYLKKPWYTVRLEIGHNEIGDADECEAVNAPSDVIELCTALGLPEPMPISVMRLEFQIAQKLHGVSAPHSRRAHDLIDLQLILMRNEINMPMTADICRRLFAYRQVHAWPPRITKGEGWETVYDGQRMDLPVLESVDAAIEWCNELIARLDSAVSACAPSPTQGKVSCERGLKDN